MSKKGKTTSVVEKYVDNESTLYYSKEYKRAAEKNRASCTVCGCKTHIELYRKTVGEFKGNMSSSHLLLASSAQMSMSGRLDTDKVLSCRDCKNEKLIEKADYRSATEIFWQDLSGFYFGVDSGEPERFTRTPKIYLENPIDTYNYAVENANSASQYYNEIVEWSPEVWAAAGFNINKVTRKFLWHKREMHPTWKQLLTK